MITFADIYFIIDFKKRSLRVITQTDEKFLPRDLGCGDTMLLIFDKIRDFLQRENLIYFQESDFFNHQYQKRTDRIQSITKNIDDQ